MFLKRNNILFKYFGSNIFDIHNSNNNGSNTVTSNHEGTIDDIIFASNDTTDATYTTDTTDTTVTS